jgi:hypothetical protein
MPVVGLITRHFQSVTPCDSPSYLSCLSDRFIHRSYLSHSGLGALQCFRQVVVTCNEYYAKCLALCMVGLITRQCHTLRLAIAHLPIRLLGPWLDTVQPRPKDAFTRPASRRRHIPESRHCDAECLLAFRMVGLIVCTSSLSHPATRHHISLAYPIALVIASICHTLAWERFNASVKSLSHAMSIMPSVLHSAWSDSSLDKVTPCDSP